MLTATPRRQRGMNIIEIAFTILILAMLFTFALPQYGIWLNNSQTRASAEGVVNALQFARAEAVSRNLAGGITFQVSGNDWSVFETGTPANVLRGQSGADKTPNAVLAATGGDTIVFNSFGRASANVQIDVTNSRMACQPSGDIRCLRVTVTTSGQIRMCDPTRTAGDPQAC